MGLLSAAQKTLDRRELVQQGRAVLLVERRRLLRWQGELLLEAERRGVSVRELVGLEGPRE